MLSSYPEVFNFGHKCLDPILDGPVVVEEKVDGSQFSFGRVNGEYFCRSKGRDQTEDTDKMFLLAKQNTEFLPLVDGWIYRGELLNKPKHNTLCYERVPVKNVILYDIDKGDQDYLTHAEMRKHCGDIGLECVQLFYQGQVKILSGLLEFLKTPSTLGGPIEGMVIKNYGQYAPNKKVLMAKIVQDEFKEKHRKEWKNSNPSGKDKIGQIAQEFCTEARWDKAVQHLRDDGRLEGTPKDIGNLIKAVQQDIEKECAGEIKDRLWNWAKPHVSRVSTRGLPEWYKNKLREDWEEQK